jgi:hypothetical protein
MLKFTLTAFLAYAVLLEALAVLGVVGSQIRAHARNLDVAWAAGFAVFVVGPLLITLAVPAVLLTAALVWRRRHTTGATRTTRYPSVLSHSARPRFDRTLGWSVETEGPCWRSAGRKGANRGTGAR